jgi:hypothetical protein
VLVLLCNGVGAGRAVRRAGGGAAALRASVIRSCPAWAGCSCMKNEL